METKTARGECEVSGKVEKSKTHKVAKAGKQAASKTQRKEARVKVNKKLIGMVFVLANKKGGVGKTTIATNLVERTGAVLVDLDPQGNAADWAEGREGQGDGIVFHRLGDAPMEDVIRVVQEARENGCVVIDCPPGENHNFRVALGLATAILVPFKPGRQDLKAVIETTNLIKEHVLKVNPDVKVMIVQNEARPQDENGLTGMTVASIKTLVPDAKFLGAIRNRKVYAVAYSASTVPNTEQAESELAVIFKGMSRALGTEI
jgi:chromosome partitioning protein